ncbi:recombinase family protein [Borborobacter arsenicus]|uniref:recombinase family protein n=1 Tax=Borborobacter arsenicus TaxID=1851146 RepID=UPI00315CB034
MGRPWTRGTVHQILTNEKYVGNNVFNRVSFKLKKRRVRNPPDMLVRAAGAFEAIVPPDLFFRAAAMIVERNRRFTEAEMLDGLKALRDMHGHLSALMIDEHDNLPSSSAYRTRFGSLLRAYKLIGYTPQRDYRYVEINRFLRELHADLVSETVQPIEGVGASVVRDPATDLLVINGEFITSIVVARCLQTPTGSLRWKVRFDTGLHPDITIAIRMDAENRSVMDYYLLPHLDFPADRIRMQEENGLHLDAYRVDSLDPFLNLTTRSNIRRAA